MRHPRLESSTMTSITMTSITTIIQHHRYHTPPSSASLCLLGRPSLPLRARRPPLLARRLPTSLLDRLVDARAPVLVHVRVRARSEGGHAADFRLGPAHVDPLVLRFRPALEVDLDSGLDALRLRRILSNNLQDGRLVPALVPLAVDVQLAVHVKLLLGVWHLRDGEMRAVVLGNGDRLPRVQRRLVQVARGPRDRGLLCWVPLLLLRAAGRQLGAPLVHAAVPLVRQIVRLDPPRELPPLHALGVLTLDPRGWLHGDAVLHAQLSAADLLLDVLVVDFQLRFQHVRDFIQAGAVAEHQVEHRRPEDRIHREAVLLRVRDGRKAKRLGDIVRKRHGPRLLVEEALQKRVPQRVGVLPRGAGSAFLGLLARNGLPVRCRWFHEQRQRIRVQHAPIQKRGPRPFSVVVPLHQLREDEVPLVHMGVLDHDQLRVQASRLRGLRLRSRARLRLGLLGAAPVGDHSPLQILLMRLKLLQLVGHARGQVFAPKIAHSDGKRLRLHNWIRIHRHEGLRVRGEQDRVAEGQRTQDLTKSRQRRA
mmetsp:Transcript_11481/g.42869  ORF Transcript_11481/g.42869 Transcript_11481/m.42869 type:complete len:536 (+) Transcript_11481:163-1770(+)